MVGYIMQNKNHPNVPLVNVQYFCCLLLNMGCFLQTTQAPILNFISGNENKVVPPFQIKIANLIKIGIWRTIFGLHKNLHNLLAKVLCWNDCNMSCLRILSTYSYAMVELFQLPLWCQGYSRTREQCSRKILDRVLEPCTFCQSDLKQKFQLRKIVNQKFFPVVNLPGI